MRPSKSDFPSFVDFPQVIEDSLINPRINDAFKFDIRPKLGQLADDILAYNGSDRPQLRAFYNNFLLHWWVLLAYKRFFELHGVNLTQFGVTKTKGDTFEQASTDEKAILLRQLNHDIGILYSNILAETWKFDDEQYRKPGGESCHPRTNSGTGINAIGGGDYD